MKSMILSFGFGIGLGIFVIYLIREWILSLLFYSKNGWNFSVDSGRKKFGGGVGKFGGSPIYSNRYTVLFGYPCAISIALFFFAGWLLGGLKF